MIRSYLLPASLYGTTLARSMTFTQRFWCKFNRRPSRVRHYPSRCQHLPPLCAAGQSRTGPCGYGSSSTPAMVITCAQERPALQSLTAGAFKGSPAARGASRATAWCRSTAIAAPCQAEACGRAPPSPDSLMGHAERLTDCVGRRLDAIAQENLRPLNPTGQRRSRQRDGLQFVNVSMITWYDAAKPTLTTLCS
jgi:hypothetical protein